MERGHALSVESTYFHSIPEFDSIADATLIVALETYFMQSQLIKNITRCFYEQHFSCYWLIHWQ